MHDEAASTVQVPKDAEFPEICVKCGADDDLTLRILPLTHTPPGVVCLTPLVGILASRVLVQNADVTASFCSRCDAHRIWSKRLRRLVIVSFASPLGLVIATAPDSSPEVLLFGIACAVLAFVTLMIWSARWRGIGLADVDSKTITLERVSPRFVSAIQRGISQPGRSAYR